MSRGRLFAVVGPSGAGKDTLMAEAARRDPGLVVVRRVITRPEAAGGETFRGVSENEFARLRAAGAFALDWRAHGLRYGIPASIDADLAAGRRVVFNGSRAVLRRARDRYPDLTVLYVTAPAEILADRLIGRGRESPEDIESRLARRAFDPADGPATHRIENDGSLARGVARFLAAIGSDRATT